MRLRPTRDPVEWSRCLARAGGTFAHSWEWNSWIAPLIESHFVPLIVESDGEPVGVAPMMMRRRGPVAAANIVPFSFLGPVVPPELLTPTCRALRSWAIRRGVVRLRLTVHASAESVEGSLADGGFTEEPYLTYAIDLRDGDLDAVFTSFKADVRGAVRRSVKKGVVIRESSPEELRTLLPEVVARAVNADLRYPAAVGRSLADQPPPFPIHCVSAVVDGEAVGISITAGDSVPFGWLAGVRPGCENTQANTAMVWESVRWAVSTGAGSLDMLGAPSPGIAAFKQKFNPTVLTHRNGTWELPGLGTTRRLAGVGLRRGAEALRRGRTPTRPTSRPLSPAANRAPVTGSTATMVCEPAPARRSGGG